MNLAAEVGVGAHCARPGGPAWIRLSRVPAWRSSVRGRGWAAEHDTRGDCAGMASSKLLRGLCVKEDEVREEARRDRTGDVVRSDVSVEAEGSLVRSREGLFIRINAADIGLWTIETLGDVAGSSATFRRMNFSAAVAAGVGRGSGMTSSDSNSVRAFS
mmetsp:Transcript_27576/g.79502  ORF Transcript_27576/g.79502 Transcript_27576/m.79502 type:complete len:159 (+) Transcript_27576:373-849(+)